MLCESIVFFFLSLISTSYQCQLTCFWLKGQKMWQRPMIILKTVAFANIYITISAMTHNQINPTLNHTANSAFRAEGHFWPDYYSMCDESGFYWHSLLSQPCRILPSESGITLLCLSCSSFAVG